MDKPRGVKCYFITGLVVQFSLQYDTDCGGLMLPAMGIAGQLANAVFCATKLQLNFSNLKEQALHKLFNLVVMWKHLVP